MVHRHCRGRLDLFPSTQLITCQKNTNNNKNDNVPFSHVETLPLDLSVHVPAHILLADQCMPP